MNEGPAGKSAPAITVSLGVRLLGDDDALRLDDALADAAMYEVKQSERDGFGVHASR